MFSVWLMRFFWLKTFLCSANYNFFFFTKFLLLALSLKEVEVEADICFLIISRERINASDATPFFFFLTLFNLTYLLKGYSKPVETLLQRPNLVTLSRPPPPPNHARSNWHYLPTYSLASSLASFPQIYSFLL